MFQIGMFSKLGRVTIKTLRHYDEEGLLAPAHIDAESGYRYYTTDQLFRLNQIIALRQMGFSIPEIAEIVDGRNVNSILERRLGELAAERERVADQFFRLQTYISEQKEGHLMDYQAVIKEIPAFTVFYAERVLSDYAALNELMPAIRSQVNAQNPGIQCVKPEYCFNIYLDGEYRDHDIRVAVCQAVTSHGRDTEDITFKELPAVTVASVLHRGPYEELSDAYAYAIKWAEQNGYRICGNIRESYIDGPWNRADAKDWLTEIQVPIEKR